MFKLLALTSVLTSAVLAQTPVGFLNTYIYTSFIILFSNLQTPSFLTELVHLAPRFWLHLIRIPRSPAAFLRWRKSPPYLPQAPQPLQIQTLRLLWPISARVQWQGRVPSLSFAHRSQVSSVHVTSSWPKLPSNPFKICMRCFTQCSPSNSPYAQRTIRAIIALMGRARPLATSMRTTRFPFLIYWPSFTPRQTMVPSHAEMKPPYPTCLQSRQTTLCFSFSHPISVQLNCASHASAWLWRPTSISSRTFRLHIHWATAFS